MNQVLRGWFTLLGFALPLGAAEPPVVTEENVSSFYRDFQPLTSEPRLVAPATFYFCRASPKPEVMEEEKRKAGPHFMSLVQNYANGPGFKTLALQEGVFPAGSILVKEKLGENKSVLAIGGMIKRVAGYDPKNGDWEYFYSSRSGGFSSGRLENCSGCHAGARKTDYVFKAWESPAAEGQRAELQQKEADVRLLFEGADNICISDPHTARQSFPLAALPQQVSAATTGRNLAVIVMGKSTQVQPDAAFKQTVDDLQARFLALGFKRVVFHLASSGLSIPVYRE